MSPILSILVALLCAIQMALSVHGLTQLQVSTNCSATDVQCGGPTPVCCPSGFKCNFHRAIPVCENPHNLYTGGYSHTPCIDPYLTSCNSIGINGFCCPIGTLCFNDGASRTVTCVNAQGTTASAYPSSATGVVPSATTLLPDNTGIVYSPSNAWNVSTTDANCTSSNMIYTTDTINATISFNYSGPSVEVHVLTALNGGVFSILVDGFNTTSTIDTFTDQNAGQIYPLCYPNTFPPVAVAPPQFSSQDHHTITLVFIGPSFAAPANTTKVIGQFNAFAIPEFAASKNYATPTPIFVRALYIIPVVALYFS